MHDNDLINDLDNQSRLSWACRRGMLELDVLLSNFLNEAYFSLSVEEKRVFVTLLREEDPELFAWLMGNKEPENPAFLAMTQKIRHHAYTRNHG